MSERPAEYYQQWADRVNAAAYPNLPTFTAEMLAELERLCEMSDDELRAEEVFVEAEEAVALGEDGEDS
jgi:hypothetical protein